MFVSDNAHGRAAVLRDLVSKPELNGFYVVIEGSNSTKNRYTVRTLATDSRLAFFAKPTSLTFVSSDVFSSCFPKPQVFQFPCRYINTATGCVLDFSAGEPTEIMLLSSPLRVQGAATPFLSVEKLCPTTKLCYDIDIHPPHDDMPMEFQDLHFAQPVGKRVFCFQGNSIIFRRCKFSGSRGGIFVGISTWTMKVVFESCLFEGCLPSALFVGNTSRVTLLNCVVRNCHNGVAAENGGHVTMIHCTVTGTSQYALVAEGKTGRIDITNSTLIDNGGEGVYIKGGSNAVIKGCLFKKCMGMAIGIEGPKRTTAVVEDTVVTECASGVFLRFGAVNLTATNLTVTNGTHYGVYAPAHIIGNVALNNCTLRENAEGDLVNMTGTTCCFTVNGAQLRQDDQQARMDEVREVQRATYDEGDTSNHRLTLRHRRLLKKTVDNQTNLVFCDFCAKEEDVDVKFKACSKCKEACYCSRECQKAHWKEHKKVCGDRSGLIDAEEHLVVSM